MAAGDPNKPHHRSLSIEIDVRAETLDQVKKGMCAAIGDALGNLAVEQDPGDVSRHFDMSADDFDYLVTICGRDGL